MEIKKKLMVIKKALLKVPVTTSIVVIGIQEISEMVARIHAKRLEFPDDYLECPPEDARAAPDVQLAQPPS